MKNSAYIQAKRYSRFVSHWTERLGETVFAGDDVVDWSRERLQAELSALMDMEEGEFWTKARILRQRVVVSLVVADLSREIPLEVVMQTMSHWADVIVQAGLDYYTPRLMSRYGIPRNSKGEQMPLWVVGMGKLGGYELNVSSDIDLVFLFEEDGITEGALSISHTEFFAELGKKLIAFLNTLTEYGQIFRVDMRLRPYGDSGPLVSSLDGLEDYFSTQGRLWERYAWVRARVLNTERLSAEAIAALERQIQSFVFRRYWDFDAYEGLREIYSKIRAEAQRKNHSLHIKLGEGGIRYIEFIAQLFQLVRGGRKPELRSRSTLQTLATLRDIGVLDVQTVNDLIDDYRFLRDLEHRLQYKEDQCTHILPSTDEGWSVLALAYPEYTVDELQAKIEDVRKQVSLCFYNVIQLKEAGDSEMASAITPPIPLYSEPGTLIDRLEECGLKHELAERVSVKILEWMRSLRFRRLPGRSQNNLEYILPYLVKASTEYGETALIRGLDVLEAVSSRSSYVALFREHLPVLDRLLRVLSISAWSVSYLKQYPLLLDELIHGIPDQESLDKGAAQAELQRGMLQSINEEQQMEHLRHWQRIQTFRCLCCDVGGLLPVESASDYLSWIADQLIGAALRGAWQALPQQHCDMPHLAVLAYGKLGGRELGYAGDIDIVFLYDDPFELAPVRYARLTQKWIHWMTALTPAGRLYEVDMRLRPEGESGLLISSWSAFERYQQERAQVWEHQALTRARWVAGDISLKNRFDALRTQILTQSRDRNVLWKNICSMRDKMRLQHPDLSQSFDIKRSRGGLIDIEFVVQFWVLGWGCEDAALLSNKGNIELLHHIGRSGYIPLDIVERVADTYRELRIAQHQCQLQSIEAVIPRSDPRIAQWQASVEALYQILPQS